MMEPTGTTTNGNIELSDVGATTLGGAPSVDETVDSSIDGENISSMDIEQSLPTVQELTGKSDNEDTAARRPRKAAFCMMYALPFMVVAVVVIVVAVVTTQKNKAAYEANLRNMDHDEAFNYVVEYLGDHDVSDEAELIREGSYQNQAAKWMAHGDAHSNEIPKVSPASKEGYSFIQRYIMALLYYQMSGPTWKYDLNFLKGESTCEWASWIVRAENTIPMGAICNDNDLISALVFVGADVRGRFPTELAKLTTLRVIEMDVNEISGSIPQSFHTLTNLENLHLSHNKLIGTLDSYLGSFNKLVSIDVSFNMMEGVLPTELGTMDMLRGIAVDHNLFHGTPNFWGHSRHTAGQNQEALEYLFLENNFFEGYLEETMIAKVPNLVALDISDNQFKGGIPPNLFLLKQLQVLDLHDNAFTGPIPHGMPSSNTNLQFLALHKNELSGRIGEEIANLQALRHFDVSNNKLTGYDMDEMTGFGLPALKQLTYLFLAANDFPAGPIPEWVRNMKQLEELSLKSLKLDGTIPTWFGELTNLILLDLDDNDLRGSIPTEFGSMRNLQFLLLNRNELTEQIPVELADLNLRVLYLDKNALEGDMEMFCKRADIFNPIIVADCGGTNPEVECDCCRKCCIDGEECNDDNIVPSNDPLWQFGYNRIIYSFGNYTGFFWASAP